MANLTVAGDPVDVLLGTADPKFDLGSLTLSQRMELIHRVVERCRDAGVLRGIPLLEVVTARMERETVDSLIRPLDTSLQDYIFVPFGWNNFAALLLDASLDPADISRVEFNSQRYHSTHLVVDEELSLFVLEFEYNVQPGELTLIQIRLVRLVDTTPIARWLTPRVVRQVLYLLQVLSATFTHDRTGWTYQAGSDEARAEEERRHVHWQWVKAVVDRCSVEE